METVKTFARYTSISGRDPFDDLRLLSFYESLFRNDIEYESFINLLIEMLSILEFSRTKESVTDYTQTFEIYNDDGVEMGLLEASSTLMKSFDIVLGETSTQKAERIEIDGVSKDSPMLAPVSVLDEDGRRLLKSRAMRKNNTVMVLLSNAIQVGASLDVIMEMEYTHAVSFINYRAEVLEKQYNQKKNK